MKLENEKRIWFAQSLRGIAALSVVFTHMFFMFWKGNPGVSTISHTEPLNKEFNLFYFPLVIHLDKVHFNIGAFGVALFFLISGFVIPISLNKMGSIKFLIARFFRIYPTYIIGLCITCFTIYIYCYSKGTAFPYSGLDVFHNITLLLDWFWTTSIDYVNWTLETEIKFYILLAVLTLFFSLKNQFTVLITSAVLSFIPYFYHDKYNLYLQSDISNYKLSYILSSSSMSLIFMLIGVCFYNRFKEYWSLKKFIVTIQIVYFFFIASVYFGPQPALKLMHMVTYTMALVIFMNFYIFQESIKYSKILNFLSNISYPLYLIHGINGYIMMNVLYRYLNNAYIVLLVTFSATIIMAYLLHLLVEKPSNNLGKWIISKCKFKTYTPMFSKVQKVSESDIGSSTHN